MILEMRAAAKKVIAERTDQLRNSDSGPLGNTDMLGYLIQVFGYKSHNFVAAFSFQGILWLKNANINNHVIQGKLGRLYKDDG